MKKHFLLIAALAATMLAQANVIVDETFNQTDFPGTETETGWSQSGNAGENDSRTIVDALTYSNEGGTYVLSEEGHGMKNSYTGGSGLSLLATKSITKQQSGVIYLSFLYKADGAQGQANSAIFGLSPSNTSAALRIWAGRQTDEAKTSDPFRLGITRVSGTGADIQWSENTYSVDDVHLIVVKYDFVNSAASFYVDPVIGGDEPTTPAAIDDSKGTAKSAFSFLCFYSNGSNKANFITSGIRVSTTWAEAVEAAAPAEDPDYANSLYADFSNDSTKWTSLDNAPTSSKFPTDTLNDYILTATAIVKSGKTLYFDDNNLKYVKFTTRAHMDKINFNGSIETPWLASIETLYLYAHSGSENKNFKIQTRVANGQWEDLATITNTNTTQIFAIPVNKSNIKLRIVNMTTSAQYFYYIGDQHPEVYAQLRESMKKEKGETAFGEGNTYTTSTAVGKHGTICLPYNCSVSGATIYAYQEKTGEGLVFEVAEQQVVEAGKAYIYFATENSQTWTKIDDPENTAKDVDITGNFIGTYADYDLKNNEYFLYTAGTQDEFRPAGENVYVPKFRAFVSKTLLNYVESENAAVRIVFPTHNPIVTGVEEATAAKATKALVNGKLVIVRGAHTFNANGAMLK